MNKSKIIMNKLRKIPGFALPILILSLLFNFYLLFDRLGGEIFRKEESFGGRVVRVIDGDTFDIEEGVRVRLAGASAPEYPEGCLSLEAKGRVEELILGKEVELEVVGEDNFGRKISFVRVGDIFIDKVMIEEGLAKAAGEREKYGEILLEAEDSAKQAKRGIWSSLCLPKEGCVIKGNVRRDRGTRVYHLPECFNYQKIVINEKEGDRWFCSEKEAKKAGFAKSEDCPE